MLLPQSNGAYNCIRDKTMHSGKKKRLTGAVERGFAEISQTRLAIFEGGGEQSLKAVEAAK